MCFQCFKGVFLKNVMNFLSKNVSAASEVSSANVIELILDFWCSPTSVMSLSIFATKAGPHSAMDTMRANMVGLNN